jgi:membrane-associated protease RseP (regulator of RpoE activity)
MNPEYLSEFGHVPSYAELIEKKGELGLLHIGNSLIFYFFESFVADPRRLPNHLEIQHYPFLFAGFITLFFTALNLLPVGQLDGGHITYGLFGARIAGIISRIFVLLCVLYGGIGLIEYNHKLSDWLLPFLIYLAYAFFVVIRVTGRDKPLYAALIVGCILLIQYLISPKASLETNAIWLIYAFMAVSIIGLDHPPADTIEPLGIKRKIIGYLALVIFIISISPRPLFIHVSQSAIDKGIFTKK